jgi:FkbM family methyltransferase
MSILRAAAIRVANSLPVAWKRSLKWQLSIPDMAASFANMRRNGFEPRVALDIGAYVGRWTQMVRGVWPACRVCMFEPQAERQEGLRLLARQLPGVELKATALGEHPDTSVTFYALPGGGSSTTPSKNMGDVRPTVLPSTTLTAAVAGTDFANPDLVKIDVQGAELRVMRGGMDVIAGAEVVVLEVSTVEEYDGGPLFAEIVRFMADQKFRVYDICTIWRNNRTMSMNEVDVIFVRAGSKILTERNYRR